MDARVWNKIHRCLVTIFCRAQGCLNFAVYINKWCCSSILRNLSKIYSLSHKIFTRNFARRGDNKFSDLPNKVNYIRIFGLKWGCWATTSFSICVYYFFSGSVFSGVARNSWKTAGSVNIITSRFEICWIFVAFILKWTYWKADLIDDKQFF